MHPIETSESLGSTHFFGVLGELIKEQYMTELHQHGDYEQQSIQTTQNRGCYLYDHQLGGHV
jgi:hypothetical protein